MFDLIRESIVSTLPIILNALPQELIKTTDSLVLTIDERRYEDRYDTKIAVFFPIYCQSNGLGYLAYTFQSRFL